MAIFQVTKLTDANNGVDVVGVSLRNAIEAANANTGRDVIGRDTELSGSITSVETEIPSLCALMATIATKL